MTFRGRDRKQSTLGGAIMDGGRNSRGLYRWLVVGLLTSALFLVVAKPSAAYLYSKTPSGSSCEFWLSAGEYMKYDGSSGTYKLAAYGSTELFSGPPACDLVRVHLWGSLFGIPWDSDTGWVSGGYAGTDYWGHCSSAEHKAASGPYTWGPYSC